jgi:hypothetical protein
MAEIEQRVATADSEYAEEHEEGMELSGLESRSVTPWQKIGKRVLF